MADHVGNYMGCFSKAFDACFLWNAVMRLLFGDPTEKEKFSGCAIPVD